MPENLSLAEARTLVLHSQLLPSARPAGDTLMTTLQAIEHLGYIQIDTIAVVERAHHHTLWARNPCYQPVHLAHLLEQKQVFEYWAHAAAYLPMRDFRFSLPRKEAIAREEQEHWGARDKVLMREVLARIRDEGPLLAKDFEHNGQPTREWERKPAKRALEYLFMQGDLMVPRRQNFHKVYELTERVLPAAVDTRAPTTAEYADFLILSYLRAHGLARPGDFGYLLKGLKTPLLHALQGLLEAGRVLMVQVEGASWYLLPESLAQLDKPLSRRLQILSPFDNLLIQRERMRRLFDFDYQIECYVPAAKRKFGYFSLPILWDGRLVARMDCKADRRRKILTVHHLALEDGLGRRADFRHALGKEMGAFLAFNGCEVAEGLASF